MGVGFPAEVFETALEVTEPLLEIRTAVKLSDAEGDWLCGWCHSRVANERDRFNVEGRDEFVFTNPEGIRFAIITFSEAPGCTQSGVATLQHTWFAGFAWSYCHCQECGQHLGWHYSGKEQVFVGLIKSRIVRAVYLRN